MTINAIPTQTIKHKMTDTKVSVVIPAFNESQTIADLIHRILQRYPEFEVVVIDDGSDDNTAEVG